MDQQSNIRRPVLDSRHVVEEVDNDGVSVHPVPPPNHKIMEKVRKINESKRELPLLETLENKGTNNDSESSKQARHH